MFHLRQFISKEGDNKKRFDGKAAQMILFNQYQCYEPCQVFFNPLASPLIPELLFKHCDFRGMASCSSANSTGVDKGSGVS